MTKHAENTAGACRRDQMLRCQQTQKSKLTLRLTMGYRTHELLIIWIGGLCFSGMRLKY